MRRFAFALLLFCSTGAEAKAPLFDAFLAFCAATHADPDGVRAAVAGVHGRQTFPVGGAKSPATVWKPGRALWVTIGAYDAGRSDREFCTVSSPPGDEASLAAAREWAAVAPNGHSGSTFASYQFREVRGRHFAATLEDAAVRAAASDRPLWSLGVMRGRRGTFITLTPETPR
ncbi:MAG: hypothetical protein JOZ72_12460 [Alphaproteobacteria bacterium]|nr:hypothetical protein [Alphaproteobacteria bacterium]